jgi:thiamine-phosphate pyrophosphorylase
LRETEKAESSAISAMILMPRLYAVLDPSCFSTIRELLSAAEELVEAGVTLIQYRNKSGDAKTILDQAKRLMESVSRARAPFDFAQGRSAPSALSLIMNDRADLCIAAGFDGVHVGQDDLSPDSARRIIGRECWLGVSAHNAEQVAEADKTSANYIAIGPVFATFSKANPGPLVGLEGVRNVRKLTKKPLVAIGGITRANCRSVIQAGADSVAVISDLIRDPGKSAEEFLRILG